MASKKRKPGTWTFWMGFSDGEPCVWTERVRGENVLSASKWKQVVANHYTDVRRVTVTEILPKPRKAK